MNRLILELILFTLFVPVVNMQGQSIVAAEYFIDSDPGVGNGTSIPSFSPSLDTTLDIKIHQDSLSAGPHYLFIRVIDVDGKWSHYEGRPFYILNSVQSPAPSTPIATAEFFINNDPGVGNGTPIPPFTSADDVNLNLSLHEDSLSAGPHYLFIRVRDQNGKWSHYEGRPFYVLDNVSQVASTPISKAEFFVDNDPGVGNGTAIPSFSPGNDITLNLSVNEDSLSTGPHYLFIRVADQDGKWSLYEGRAFYVLNESIVSISAPLVAAEYFIDTDPGVGNGIALDSFAPIDSILVDGTFTRDTVTSLGMHSIFVRYKDGDGKWGHYEGREFEIVDCNYPRVEFDFSETCLSEMTLLNDSSKKVDSNATYAWDIGNNGVVDYTDIGSISHTFPDTGTYDIELKITNTDVCKDSVVQSVTIHPVDTTKLDTVEICDGDSTQLFGAYYSISGFQYDTVTSSLFCDSILHQYLLVHPVFVDSNSLINKCFGFGDTIFGSFENTTGIYIDSSLSIYGCDSVTNQELIIRPQYRDTLTNLSTCSNDGTEVFNIFQDSAGFYTNHLFTDIYTCDSIKVRYLVVLPISEVTDVDLFVCQGDSTSVFGVNRGIAGFYYDTLTKTNGCDSIVEQKLIMLTDTTVNIPRAEICPGDSALIFGQYHNTANVYYDSSLRPTGCDSISIQELFIQPA